MKKTKVTRAPDFTKNASSAFQKVVHVQSGVQLNRAVPAKSQSAGTGPSPRRGWHLGQRNHGFATFQRSLHMFGLYP